jgi:hypothetical protein
MIYVVSAVPEERAEEKVNGRNDAKINWSVQNIQYQERGGSLNLGEAKMRVPSENNCLNL